MSGERQNTATLQSVTNSSLETARQEKSSRTADDDDVNQDQEELLSDVCGLISPSALRQAEELMEEIPSGQADIPHCSSVSRFPAAAWKKTLSRRQQEADSTSPSTSEESENETLDVEIYRHFERNASVPVKWCAKKLWKHATRLPLKSDAELWRLVIGSTVPSNEEASSFSLVVTAYRFAQNKTVKAAERKIHELKLFMS